MKGFVQTPEPVVDFMVEKLFCGKLPAHNATLLDPGCGRGAFIEGVIRWCVRNRRPLPTIVGVESNPQHVAVATPRFAAYRQVQIRHADFLSPSDQGFDYIIGNPPYVPITALTTNERETYRKGYATAKGRFDLYLLFFEQALSLLNPQGRLVFITPEKFLYVDTARPLREILRRFSIEELQFLDEQTFGELVTYPLVSTVLAAASSQSTRVVHRDGHARVASLKGVSTSWLPVLLGADCTSGDLTLADICIRVSAGIATGADAVFLALDAHLDPRLRDFAHPTIAGRQLVPGQPLSPLHCFLVPYAADGSLLLEHQLGALGGYLSNPTRRDRLLARTCVARKPWYAYHETPALQEVLRPKLLCKDIVSTPFFIPDRVGTILPRHSVYY
ncbi:MAG: HsdM family class I SAM-dependent methyltransferase, partial [Candidatus Binatia bacterium]